METLHTFLLAKANGGTTSSFPSFLLPDHFHHHGTDSKIQGKRAKTTHLGTKEKQEQWHELEETAPQFLSRSMLVEPYGSLKKDDNNPMTAGNGIANVPQLMLLNMQDTFCHLVDVRLRAYATILLHHSEQLEAPEKDGGDNGEVSGSTGALVQLNNQKLMSLLQMIHWILIDTMVTSFHPFIDHQNEREAVSSLTHMHNGRMKEEEGKKEKITLATLDVIMDTVMDIVMNVGNVKGEMEVKVMTVKFGSPGKITGR